MVILAVAIHKLRGGFEWLVDLSPKSHAEPSDFWECLPWAPGRDGEDHKRPMLDEVHGYIYGEYSQEFLNCRRGPESIKVCHLQSFPAVAANL